MQALKRASILQGTFAKRTQVVGCSKHLGELTTDLLRHIFQNLTEYQSRAPAAIFLHAVPMFTCTVQPLGLISISDVWLFSCNSCTKTATEQIFQTIDGCTWVPLVSASCEPMALLDIFWFHREINLMCFISAASFLGQQLHLQSSMLLFFVLL